MKKDGNSLENQVIAMSNTLAEKSTRFTAFQQKLFYVCLASLKQGTNSKNEVKIDKQELFEYLDIKNDTARWTRLRYEFKKLASNSFIEFGTDEIYCDRYIITGSRSTRYSVYVGFDTYFLPLVQELADNYVRLLDDDVISFDSKFSMMLYQHLLKDKWKLTNVDFLGIDYSTKQLKMIFGLSADDYMRGGHFDRYNFEKKAVDKAVDEINEKSKCIKNLTYKKVKKGNRIRYYLFTFTYNDPQKVVEENRNDKRWEQLSMSDVVPEETKKEEFDEEAKNLNWWEN